MTIPVLIARFRSETGLTEAMQRLAENGIGPLQIYSPHPVGDASPSAVPKIALAAALIGFGASLGLQIYADTMNYPLDIGGRPDNSWLAFIPTAFENAVLCAVLAGFFSFVVRCLARDDLGDRVAGRIGAAMLDRYYLALQPADEAVRERAKELLAKAEQTVEVPP